MRLLSIGLAMAAFVSVPQPGVAQKAEQIIDRYIEAIGGRVTLAAVETMRYVRTVFNTEGDVTARQSRKTVYAMRPYFYRTEDVEKGRIYISDGKVAWTGRMVADKERRYSDIAFNVPIDESMFLPDS